ncbi:MAG: DUF721 domain-containing protein [Candidatus Saelkia tenebricola]|nr:DUF721 domain-containing protein [Candidatus Saelkia tenebricola]
MENSFKKILKDVLKDIKTEAPEKENIMQLWGEIGQRYTQHAVPGALKNGVLYINVEDSDWMYHCSLKQEEIKEKFRPLFKKGVIKNIKFRVGK